MELKKLKIKFCVWLEISEGVLTGLRFISLTNNYNKVTNIAEKVSVLKKFATWEVEKKEATKN